MPNRDIPQYVGEEFIEFDDKKLQSKIFNPRISSVEDHCAKRYTTEPSVIAIIFKWTLVYTSLLNSLNTVNSLTLPVKVEKLRFSCGIKNKLHQ